jgi:cell wall-associated NlpC family hydrolase
MQAIRVHRERSVDPRRVVQVLLATGLGLVTWVALPARPSTEPARANVPPALVRLPASPALDWRPLHPRLRTTPPRDPAPPAAIGEAVGEPEPMPVTISSRGSGGGVLSMAMRNVGARYVWGGTSPVGFDCSGFVWYVHTAIDRPVSRALEGQLSGGRRIPRDALEPGDTVFFENTYRRGLSHAGIYIGDGRFIHASDESSGVTISSLTDAYWGARYVGATRLW